MSMMQAACCCGGGANPCTCGWPDSFTVSVSVSGTYPGYGAVTGSGAVTISFCICPAGCTTEDGCWYESRHNANFPTYLPCTVLAEYGDVGQVLWQSAFVNTGGTYWQSQGVKLMGASLYHDGTTFLLTIVTGLFRVIENRLPGGTDIFQDQSILYPGCGATPCGPVGLSCTGCDVTAWYNVGSCTNEWIAGTGGFGCAAVAAPAVVTPSNPCDDPSGTYEGVDGIGLTWTATVA